VDNFYSKDVPNRNILRTSLILSIGEISFVGNLSQPPVLFPRIHLRPSCSCTTPSPQQTTCKHVFGTLTFKRQTIRSTRSGKGRTTHGRASKRFRAFEKRYIFDDQAQHEFTHTTNGRKNNNNNNDNENNNTNSNDDDLTSPYVDDLEDTRVYRDTILQFKPVVHRSCSRRLRTIRIRGCFVFSGMRGDAGTRRVMNVLRKKTPGDTADSSTTAIDVIGSQTKRRRPRRSPVAAGAGAAVAAVNAVRRRRRGDGDVWPKDSAVVLGVRKNCRKKLRIDHSRRSADISSSFRSRSQEY